MSISAWLRGMLEEGRYRNAVEMAEAFGVTEPAVIYWLHGQRRPSRDSCRLISAATGTAYNTVVLMAYGDGSSGGDGDGASGAD